MADIAKKRVQARKARHARIRRKVEGTTARPRLAIRRSNKHMIAQIIDDTQGVSIILETTDKKEFIDSYGSLNKVEKSKKLGEIIAQKAKDKGIETVVFDRGGFLYHGRVKALAESLREAGLKF